MKSLARSKAFYAALVVLVLATACYAYATRYVPGEITFETYSPAYLPGGLEISDKKILSIYTPSSDPARYPELQFTLSDGSLMFQSKSSKGPRDCSYAADNVSCKVAYTKNGRRFVISNLRVKDKLESQSIVWVANGTRTYVSFEHVPADGYTQEELAKVVDSFKPAKFKNLEVIERDHSII